MPRRIAVVNDDTAFLDLMVAPRVTVAAHSHALSLIAGRRATHTSSRR